MFGSGVKLVAVEAELDPAFGLLGLELSRVEPS
jgi:hypothetical protein